MAKVSLSSALVLLLIFGFLLSIAGSVVLCSLLHRRKTQREDTVEMSPVADAPEKQSFAEYEDSPESSPTSNYPRPTGMPKNTIRFATERHPTTVNSSKRSSRTESSASNGRDQRRVRINGTPIIMGLNPGKMSKFEVDPRVRLCGFDERGDLGNEPQNDLVLGDGTRIVIGDNEDSTPSSESTSPTSGTGHRSPVDSRGRRGKKSVVPAELDQAFFQKIAEENANKERV